MLLDRSPPHDRPLGAPARPVLALAALGSLAVTVLAGCESAGDYRRGADRAAGAIIERQQKKALGESKPFTIERPAETLRRKLLRDQDLQYAGPASLGTRALEPIEHWPEDDYLELSSDKFGPVPVATEADPIVLTLNEALQVAARNSRAYQSQKEAVYRAALALDLERDAFRSTWSGLLEGLVGVDHGAGAPETATVGTASASVTRRLESGATLTSRLALDVAKLLTANRPSSTGVLFDASIEIPLLRGAGRWVVTEPLTQAQRDTLYAIHAFERFKRTFAVDVAERYLGVLQALDQVRNAEENYRRVVRAARGARARAEQGIVPEIQVDQAAQDELRARNRWISARESYRSQLDSFKVQFGLPTDAELRLDRDELTRLRDELDAVLERVRQRQPKRAATRPAVPPADAPVKLTAPQRGIGGPLEIPPRRAIETALDHRLDLRTAQGEVYDAERRVAVAANRFLPELTLLGTARAGEGRSAGSAALPDAELRFDRGEYDALLTMDLPLERTAERNQYRNALIDLERAVREVQGLEDRIKLEVRDNLRGLLDSRESLRIQAQAVALARRRVDSTEAFFELGRTEIRDVLEAQDALVSAQNALTSALVSYRVTELQLQADMGVLAVNHEGLWEEYEPGPPAEPAGGRADRAGPAPSEEGTKADE